MSFFDTLAGWLGLNEPPAGEQPTASRQSSPAPANAKDDAAAMTHIAHSPYAPMWESVERRLAQFMVRSVLPHRHFAPDDVFKLVRIQVTGTTPEAQRAIDGFLNEFRPESRRRVALAAVARNCPQGVSTADFIDFNREFAPAELEEGDPYEAQLAPAHQDGYEVTLYGEWELLPARAADAAPTAHGSQAASPSTPIHLEVVDATGRHELDIASLPLVIGRSSVPGPAIAGKFVSRRHGLIERDEQGRIWYRETSVNGSTMDGVPIRSGERRPLRNGARLRLGGDTADVAECPEVVVRWSDNGADDANTPLRAPLREGADATTPLRAPLGTPNDGVSPAATPLSARPPGPLCLLAIKDAQGSRTVAVTALPFVIGRSETAQCRVPEDNAGVSRDHLVVRSVDANGLHVDNNAAGKWGTEVDGLEQPARFLLPWGRQATLAARFTKAPPVTVLALEASP